MKGLNSVKQVCSVSESVVMQLQVLAIVQACAWCHRFLVCAMFGGTGESV